MFQRFRAAGTIFLPLVVLGELHFGAHRSPDPVNNLVRINRFVQGTVVLLPDTDRASEYGRLKSELTAAGKIIPDNDLWIAALALQHDLPLASRDQPFAHVPRLKWLQW